MNQEIACGARQTCSMIFQRQSRRKKIQVINRLIVYILIVMTYMTLVYRFRCLYLMDRCNIPYHIKKNELERTAHQKNIL